MQNYCEKCCIPFDEDRCPVCRRKAGRCVEPDDLCFLTEKEQVWGGMLADVLTQQDIPFIQKSVLGAGIAMKIGPARERVRFYVFYRHLSEAGDIVNGLFSSSGEENTEE